MPRTRCITSARFSMICDIIAPQGAPPPVDDATTEGDETKGHWEWRQDEESGALIQEWVRNDYDNPNTPAVDGTVIKDVPLFAEGFLDGGLRVAGTTEDFDKVYQSRDYVNAVFPPDVIITKRHRVANIRNKRSGEVLWVEEEFYGHPSTMFNVQGVIPVIFMGKLVEKSVLLERTEVQ